MQQNIHEGGHESTVVAGTLPAPAEESRASALGSGRVWAASDQPSQRLTAQTQLLWS